MKAAVLEEDGTAKCIKTNNGYAVKSKDENGEEGEIYGEGNTRDQAWENAIAYILGLN